MVLATLWPVEDHPNVAAPMKGFYSLLAELPPAWAFRFTQAKILKDRAMANLWSAFATLGQ